MRALSIRQPWAWCILYGGKDVENRTWPTRFRGDFLVHAGVAVDKAADEKLRPHIEAVPDPRPPAVRGALIGVVRLVDCVRVEDLPPGRGAWGFGPWCFLLEDPRPFATPVALRGRLGFFPVHESAALDQELAEVGVQPGRFDPQPDLDPSRRMD